MSRRYQTSHVVYYATRKTSSPSQPEIDRTHHEIRQERHTLPPHTHQDHPADSLPPPPTPSRWTAQKTSYTRQFDSNHTDGRDSAILASTASTGCFSLFLLHFFF
ncbi:hypothetical protein OUZ56_019209 [Daphnia magna]|uniref:Uncharacterized protein n=1 Tax=Daphnia magna TaxID=35525 RepID=A0ABQ9ZAY9_9CRUS|nr:hypothetical protein OUZ56_019209 [Daphnia magna]